MLEDLHIYRERDEGKERIGVVRDGWMSPDMKPGNCTMMLLGCPICI
jgi:hypothetical protein